MKGRQEGLCYTGRLTENETGSEAGRQTDIKRD